MVDTIEGVRAELPAVHERQAQALRAHRRDLEGADGGCRRLEGEALIEDDAAERRRGDVAVGARAGPAPPNGRRGDARRQRRAKAEAHRRRCRPVPRARPPCRRRRCCRGRACGAGRPRARLEAPAQARLRLPSSPPTRPARERRSASRRLDSQMSCRRLSHRSRLPAGNRELRTRSSERSVRVAGDAGLDGGHARRRSPQDARTRP